MADPFTPDTPHIGADADQPDSADVGRKQDPAGGGEDRSFQTRSQPELDAETDPSRDNHQTPRGNDAVRDTADNLGGDS